MMKTLRVVFCASLMVLLAYSFSFSADGAARGKALFNDTRLGNNTSGNSCNTCHPDGSGLEKAAGKPTADIAKVVNQCIRKALKGEPVDPESQDMKDIVAYIKTLKSK